MTNHNPVRVRPGSRAARVADYLTTVDNYLALITPSNNLDNVRQAEAETLRQGLLLGQTEMVKLLGPVHYQQFGSVRSAWDGLIQFQPSYSPLITTSLAFLRDALTAKLGELATGKSGPSLYVVTNPVFWFVSFAKWLLRAATGTFRWAKHHRAVSAAAVVVSLLAGLVTIATFVGGIFD